MMRMGWRLFRWVGRLVEDCMGSWFRDKSLQGIYCLFWDQKDWLSTFNGASIALLCHAFSYEAPEGKCPWSHPYMSGPAVFLPKVVSCHKPNLALTLLASLPKPFFFFFLENYIVLITFEAKESL